MTTIFLYIYLIYAANLYGIGLYYIWSNSPKNENQFKILNDIKISAKSLEENKIKLIEAGILVKLDFQEVTSNIDYLKKCAKEWEEYLQLNKGHTVYKLLSEFISETFTHLRELKKDIRNNFLGNNAFLHRKLQLFLFSRYAFITAKKISETFDIDKNYFALTLSNENLRFNEYSIAHILMRHYAQGIRNYSFIRDKSIHIGDFPFDKIHLILKKIFEKIEKSENLENNYFSSDIVNLRFKYRATQYFLGTKIDKNQNEKEKIPFRRIKTFHIIEEQKMLNEIIRDFKEIRIDDELTLNLKR